ncbi:MAG: hypothetical protein RR400_03420 [Clostridia bacterium]
MKKEMYENFIKTITDNEIFQYLIIELGQSEEISKEQMARFVRNPDIYSEFKYCYFNLKNDKIDCSLNYAVEKPVAIENWTAFLLYATFGNNEYGKYKGKLSPLGIFNMLIDLREHPQETLADIKAGLPTK